MPPRPKTPDEINNERELILKNALIIIVENGYAGLTMRDLAKLCNFSPTKIYYYFSNKDDIVLHIMQKGYQKLIALTVDALENESTLKGKSECVCRVLFNFGIKYSEYFNLMFAFDVPHTTDFLNDETLETKAINFKNLALSYYDLFTQSLQDYALYNNNTLNKLQVFTIFSQVIGVLKLNSARITNELNIDVFEHFEVALECITSMLNKNNMEKL